MKVLAIERELKNITFNNKGSLLKKEAQHVLDLQFKEVIREIYFTENKTAVIILECDNKEDALSILDDFPLVKNNIIAFNVFELHSYKGFKRLIN